jgi:hypothetical protein
MEQYMDRAFFPAAAMILVALCLIVIGDAAHYALDRDVVMGGFCIAMASIAAGIVSGVLRRRRGQRR